MMKKVVHIYIYSLLLFAFFITSCSTTKKISSHANQILITDTFISKGFVGISIFDPDANKYIYNYNADKYFVPASNTKLFTLYAGMKYLGDSLVGLRYEYIRSDAINIFSTGDPTFLHPDFKNQPVLTFLKSLNRTIYLSDFFRDSAFAKGWAWDDYSDDYMVERNSFPIFGNTIRIAATGFNLTDSVYPKPKWDISPKYFSRYLDSFFAARPPQPDYFDSAKLKKSSTSFFIKRERITNKLHIYQLMSLPVFSKTEIPFITNKLNTAEEILKNDFEIQISGHGRIVDQTINYSTPFSIIHSQPSDSLFKPMMHNSDNFFAEQTLLMASNEHLGFMSDEAIIDTLLKLDLKEVPQKPKWVDGSGLSRYNLFTPQDFIYILNKMKNEFGIERMKTILATGGEGTLKNYFVSDAGFIYAKTGTLSNNCALSGYIITKKNKLLIFSVLANNYQTGATPVRRAVEAFVKFIREHY